MPRRQYTIHYIYKITCNITKKYYIGMHSTFKLEDGYFGSGKRLWYSINKYGKENHIKEILEFLPDKISLAKREEQLVNKELLKDPLCMNLKLGGEGGRGWSVKQQKINNLKSQKSQKILRENNKFWVEKKSKNSRKALELRRKNGETFNNPLAFKGRKHSEETKQKMRDAKKGKCNGKNNSQYGTCWIYNLQLKENKKIKKNNLNYWLNLRWIIGRKMKFN